MVERQLGPVQVDAVGARLLVDTRLPWDLAARESHALLSDRILSEGDGTLFVAMQRSHGWPEFVAVIEYGPVGYGFAPGLLFVPENDLLFVGAGTTLVCYSLGTNPRRLWVDEADTGFWSWRRFDTRVVMAAELELAAWDTDGRKLWSTFVEPPWDYEVDGGVVKLEVMGTTCELSLDTGPDWEQLPWH